MNDYLDTIRGEWDRHADNWYLSRRTDEAIDRIAADPALAFHPGTLEMIRERVGDLRGKEVLVPSSGDNHAVYALCLMGARVTSADLSPRQIELSRAVAERRGWDIRFAVCDTMTLAAFGDEAYDFVYTSNGVHIWINDLAAMYQSVARVLRPGGAYVMYDVHPILRPFDDDQEARSVRVVKPYGATSRLNEWRLQDLLNAMTDAGLRIGRVEELFCHDGSVWFRSDDDQPPTLEMIERAMDWRQNPLAALPQWLSVYARKDK